MGYEAYDMTRERYLADIVRLDGAAVHVANSDHGDFLIILAYAWLWADSSDKRILRSAWAAIVTKYALDKEVS